MTTSQITEELIKQKAKELFFTKGMINATTQEIADAAGVNRALIHYYFRSRDRLFETVLRETSREILTKTLGIFFQKETFRMKISKFLDFFLSKNISYPYLPVFVVTAINEHPHKIGFLDPEGNHTLVQALAIDLEKAIQNNELDPITPEHFIANLMSLANYPSIARPVLESTFGFTEETYDQFLAERKSIIMQTLFRNTDNTTVWGREASG